MVRPGGVAASTRPHKNRSRTFTFSTTLPCHIFTDGPVNNDAVKPTQVLSVIRCVFVVIILLRSFKKV